LQILEFIMLLSTQIHYRRVARNSLLIGTLALLTFGAVGPTQAHAQELRIYRYNTVPPVGPTRVYGEEYRAYGYEYDRYDRDRYPANGGLAGGNSGVRSLDSTERVRTFFNDLDRTGNGGGD
jgi:hypothetical protein